MKNVWTRTWASCEFVPSQSQASFCFFFLMELDEHEFDVVSLSSVEYSISSAFFSQTRNRKRQSSCLVGRTPKRKIRSGMTMQCYWAISDSQTLVTVVEGEEIVIMQEMSTYDDKVNAEAKRGLTFFLKEEMVCDHRKDSEDLES